MFQQTPYGFDFGETPPQPLLGPSFSVPGEIQRTSSQASFVHEIVLPFTGNGAGDMEDDIDELALFDASYLRFSLVDKIAASSAEAKLLWPILRLPSWKPQGSGCHMSLLGRGYLAQKIAHLIASFLWYETDPLAGHAAAHRSVSVHWADSCQIVWIHSVGTHETEETHGQMRSLGVTSEEYPTSAGLWIHTNKDTFKLLDTPEMGSGMTHQVEVAFQKGGGGWAAHGRWFVNVWLNGLLCKKGRGTRLHPSDPRGGLDRWWSEGRVVVEWIGGCDELAVSDLQICTGELIPGVANHVEIVD